MSMKLTLSSSDPLSIAADVAVIGVPEGASHRSGAIATLTKALGSSVQRTLKREEFTGKKDQTVELATNGQLKPARVVLMGLGAQWYVLFNVLAGASAIPGDLEEASSVYRVAGLRRFATLDLPSVFPFLVTGLVTAAGGAWNASIVAETLAFRGRELTTFGLGSLITRATHEGNFPLLAAGVLAMSLALVFLNRTVWRRLYGVAATRYALNR